MKNWILFTAVFVHIFLSVKQVNCQDTTNTEEYEYLFSGDIRVGGFGGPLVSIGSVNGKTAVYAGGGGAMIINNGFYFGGYGYGLTNNFETVADTAKGSKGDVEFGHGGLWGGYTFMGRKVVHPTISLKAGWGSLNIDDMAAFQEYLRDEFFVLTPALEIEFNLWPWMKIAAGANYQWVNGLSNAYYSNDDFSQFMGSMTFKFGYFGEP